MCIRSSHSPRSLFVDSRRRGCHHRTENQVHFQLWTVLPSRSAPPRYPSVHRTRAPEHDRAASSRRRFGRASLQPNARRERTMTGRRRTTWTSLLILAGAVGLGWPATAGAAGDGFATLEAAGGQVVVIRAGQSLPPAPGMALERNDIVVTKRGRATVRFASDGTVLRVGPDSRVQVDETAAERDVTVFFGRLWAHVVRWKERPTRFTTSGTIAAVRGTELSPGRRVRRRRAPGSPFSRARCWPRTTRGASSSPAASRPPRARARHPCASIAVRPSDAVQWALYYLPVLSIRPGELGQGAPWQAKVEESAGAWSKGDLDRALASLEGLPAAEIRDPRFFTYRASLLLAAGSVEEAGKDLDQALKLAENDSSALALQSIVAVARNENDKALSLARRSVSADPKSADRADRPVLRAAGRLRPGGRPREPGEGRRARAHRRPRVGAARRDPLVARATWTGPSRRPARRPSWRRTWPARSRSSGSRTSPGSAPARPGRPSPRRSSSTRPIPSRGWASGWPSSGTASWPRAAKEIEIAVSLDPGQSLLRSYLGKAYFEAKREDLVGREYELAQQADPKDPTPYLYDAIAKQTTNRPVEALESFQKAVELNDNRAVYRSRLLLDSDLAARSASLGRIYTDLGFQDRALVEGWNSVNTDPAQLLGPPLLADSYAVLPRHEIARVSELLPVPDAAAPQHDAHPAAPRREQPVPDQLARGPGALSFNEFNPLFNRDQVNVQGSFLARRGRHPGRRGDPVGHLQEALLQRRLQRLQDRRLPREQLPGRQDRERLRPGRAQPEHQHPGRAALPEPGDGRPGPALLRGRLQPVPDGEDRGHQRPGRPAPGLRPRGHLPRVLHALRQGHRLLRSRTRTSGRASASSARRRPTASRGRSSSARPTRQGRGRRRLLRHRLRGVDRPSRSTTPIFGFTDITTGDSKIEHTNLYGYALLHPAREPHPDPGRERRPLRGDGRVLLGLPDPRPAARPADPDRASPGARGEEPVQPEGRAHLEPEVRARRCGGPGSGR